MKGRLKVKSGDEIGKMSKAMNELADTLQFNILGSLKQIADGDMNVKLESKDEKDEITPVVMETAATVKDIVNEASGIIEAVNDGNLGQALQRRQIYRRLENARSENQHAVRQRFSAD